MQSLVWTTKTA